jgi:flagellar basal body rod protein FlgB
MGFKMGSLSGVKALVVIILLVISIGVLAGYTYVLNIQVSELRGENSALKSEIAIRANIMDMLRSRVAELEDEKNLLQSWLWGNTTLLNSVAMEREKLATWLEENKTQYELQIAVLSSQVEQLQLWVQSNQTLLRETQAWLQGNITYYESQVAMLKSKIDTLNSQIAILEDEKVQLQAWLLGNATYYELQVSQLSKQIEDLNATLQAYINAYQALRDRVNMRWNHENATLFITPTDPIVQSTVYSITGGWSNTSDWNEFWIDVKALYDWVVENIEYRYDGLYPMLPDTPFGSLEFWDEMWQFPNETLKLSMGDCEDMAILLASMIRSYNDMKYSVEVVIISGAKGAHAGVQLPVQGGKIVILDPAGHYYTHDAWGNIASKDIETEINNWLNYWKPYLGSDVRVVRVFSDYIDKGFNNTSDYLSWMYSRTK